MRKYGPEKSPYLDALYAYYDLDIHGYYENLLKEASQFPGVAKKKSPILKKNWNHDKGTNT